MTFSSRSLSRSVRWLGLSVAVRGDSLWGAAAFSMIDGAFLKYFGIPVAFIGLYRKRPLTEKSLLDS